MIKFKTVNLVSEQDTTAVVSDKMGWKISGIEEGFVSLNCEVGEKKFYISANRPLAEKLKQMDDVAINKTLNLRPDVVAVGESPNLKIIPLYKNCIFDELNEKDMNKDEQFHCIYITSTVDIGTIQFKNCTLVTPIISDTNENRETYKMAFIIRTEKGKNYSLKVFNMDKNVYTITETNLEIAKVSHEIRKPMVALHGPKYIVVPNKAYFTNDNVNNVRAGMISVKANDIINNNNLIRVNRKKAEFVYGLDLTCEDIIAIKTRLGLLPKSNDYKKLDSGKIDSKSQQVQSRDVNKHTKQKYNNKKYTKIKGKKGNKQYRKNK